MALVETASDQRQRIRWAPSALVTVGSCASLTAIAAVALLLYGISTFPSVGNDEWWFTSRYDRGATYGDWSDTVAFDLYAENRSHPKFPPANAPLRMLAHGLTGIGAPLDRYLSATEFVAVAVLLGYVARRLDAPVPLAILAVPLLLLNPVVFFVARSFRFEQDIFFLGCVSVLLACLPGGNRRYEALRLAASGLAAGMAATMHVFGLAFGGGIVAVCGVCWLTGCARVPRRRAALCWLVACAIPIAATVGYYASDLANTLAYYDGNARFEAAHLERRMDNLAAAFPRLLPGLPERLHVTINALRVAQRPYDGTSLSETVSGVLAGLWGSGFLIVVFGVPLRCWRLRGDAAMAFRPPLMALLACWAATLLEVPISLLRPHADYAVYLYGLTGVTLYLLVATLSTGSNGLHPHSRTMRVAALSLLLAMVALGAAYIVPLVADPARHLGGSQAVQDRGMRLVSALAGLRPSSTDRPPIYTDTVSWAAGGARSVPLYEYLISEVVDRRDQYDAVVFRYEWYQSFVARIPTFTGVPIDVGERQHRMARLLGGLTFAGALQENFGTADRNQSRLWFARDPSDAPAFARIGPDGRLSVARGELAVDSVLDPRGRAAGGTMVLQLPAGSYFAIATSSGPEFLRLALTSGDTPLATGIPSVSLPQEQVGAILWFALSDADASATLHVDTQGRPGPISVRIWRTAWAPADVP